MSAEGIPGVGSSHVARYTQTYSRLSATLGNGWWRLLRTFRLADSLPVNVQQEIVSRRVALTAARNSGRSLLAVENVALAELSARKIEEYLDAGSGCSALRKPEVAETVISALRKLDGQHYKLLAWCIMPNHVHVLFAVDGNCDLASTVGTWKSVSGHRANEALGRKGHFWQREYYDRLMRNENEVERAVEYIRENPRRAGLVTWPWVWVREV